MIKYLSTVLLAASMMLSCTGGETIPQLKERVFSLARTQLPATAELLGPGRLPKTVRPDGSLETSDMGWWCSGFYAGSLYYVYEHTGDEGLLELARANTVKLDSLLRHETDHDVGFQLCSSYGHLYRLTGDSAALKMLQDGAAVLAARYSPVTGTIKSWNFSRGWQWPVIIDNMMNLELLVRYGTPQQREAAVSHARTTARNHFRDDYTSFHLVDYDASDGHVRGRQTVQGFSDGSAWSRGQAWALYGYTMMTRLAPEGDGEFLLLAENIARMLLERLPSDGVPAWDLDAKGNYSQQEGDPVIEDDFAPDGGDRPAILRDASAAAIMASALLQLAEITEDSALSRGCREMAETQVRSLASPEYLSEAGTNCGFLLKHSVGNIPGGTEVDVPLTYADYYFLEALSLLK